MVIGSVVLHAQPLIVGCTSSASIVAIDQTVRDTQTRLVFTSLVASSPFTNKHACR